MADVSKLNADGVIYNIKDDVARRQVEKARADFQGTLNNEYYNKGKIDDLINVKADKATTLAGYGITDTYTKTEVDTELAKKEDVLNKVDAFDNNFADASNTLYPTVTAIKKYLSDYYYNYQETYSQDEIDELLESLSGYLPTASVTQTDTGAVITITDKSGTTTATVSNGSDGAGSGISTNAKNLLVTILRNGVYSTDQNNNITALAIELGVTEGEEPEITLTDISATYSGGDVTVDTVVTDLTGIVVTATYSDGSTQTVTDYTLSGTIAEGSNTITVSYGGKTTTFTVTGVAEIVGEPVPMLTETRQNAHVYSWYTDEGVTAYEGTMATRSGLYAVASSDVFDVDTDIVVKMNTSAQVYDYFVVASTDWDGTTTPNGYVNFNCVDTGVKGWVNAGIGVAHEIHYTVKAGKRLGIYSYTSPMSDWVSVSLEVV